MATLLCRIFICLVLIFEFCYATYIELGCTNEFFKYEYRCIKQQKLTDVVFGEEERKPLHFPSSMLSSVQTGFGIVMEEIWRNSTYDTVEPMMDFFEQYKVNKIRRTYSNIGELFENYIPNFSKQGSFTQGLGLIEHMNNKTRGTSADHFFMATVWPNINLNMVARISKLDYFPDYFYHGAILPVLKFQCDFKNGFLISDVENGKVGPAVVMENDPEDQSQAYTMLNAKLKYILARDGATQHLIFVGKPYCSFITTTSKLRLLETNRYLSKRNEKGKPIASLRINMNPSPAYFGQLISFKIPMEEEENGYKIIHLSMIEIRNVSKIRHFAELSYFLNIEIKTLVNIFNTYRQIFDDETFLPEYIMLVEAMKEKQTIQELKGYII